MFALHDLPDRPETAVEQQLLARALMNMHKVWDLGDPVKCVHPETGFKCNYYHDGFKEQCMTLLFIARRLSAYNKRPWHYEHEKYQMISEYFCKPLGYDPQGWLE